MGIDLLKEHHSSTLFGFRFMTPQHTGRAEKVQSFPKNSELAKPTEIADSDEFTDLADVVTLMYNSYRMLYEDPHEAELIKGVTYNPN